MLTNRLLRQLTLIVAVLGVFAMSEMALGARKASHHDGKALLGEKIKGNGQKALDKKGNYAASVDVKDGKIAAFHVKHAQKGEVQVTKYKTTKKLATNGVRILAAAYGQEYVGTTYIGYSYEDEYGNEEIYWFPYDMILDPSGAIEYVPAS